KSKLRCSRPPVNPRRRAFGGPTGRGQRLGSLWLIIGTVAAVAVIGGLGWRMRSHSSAPAGIAGSSPSPEAALQRETERHPRSPEAWRQLGEYYLSQH